MRRLLPLLAASAALAALVPAAASAKATAFQASYKVVKATHTSSVSETNGSFNDYNGTSTASWHLGKARDGYPNSGYFGTSGQAPGSGLVSLSIKGVYADEVHTTFGQPGGDPNENNCSLTAPTGSSDYPAVAPSSAMITMIQKRRNGPVTVGFVFPMASLENPYFGTGCSHPDTVFPDDKYFIRTYPLKTFQHKRFTLVDSGAPGGKYGNYKWKTSITLAGKTTH
jgi:hypothetical protein